MRAPLCAKPSSMQRQRTGLHAAFLPHRHRSKLKRAANGAIPPVILTNRQDMHTTVHRKRRAKKKKKTTGILFLHPPRTWNCTQRKWALLHCSCSLTFGHMLHQLRVSEWSRSVCTERQQMQHTHKRTGSSRPWHTPLPVILPTYVPLWWWSQLPTFVARFRDESCSPLRPAVSLSLCKCHAGWADCRNTVHAQQFETAHQHCWVT